VSKRRVLTNVLKQLYADRGWGIERIARHLRVSRTAVYYNLLKMGLIRRGRSRAQIPQAVLDRFKELLEKGWPPKTAARECNIPWHIGVRIACELGHPPFTKSEGMKRFRKIAAGLPVNRELPILSKEELFEAMVVRADQVFLTDFMGYNYTEKKALCRAIFDALPSKLQERLFAYTIALMGKGKTVYLDVARTIQKQGFLRNIRTETLAELVRLWQEGAHPLRRYLSKRRKAQFIKGDLEYLIGRFLGDASVASESQKQKALKLSSIDLDSICYASQLLANMNMYNKIYYSIKKGLYIALCYNMLIYWLLRRLKDSPEFAEKFGDYLCLDPNIAWRFIQGMADSEGCPVMVETDSNNTCVRVDIANTKQHILELCKRCFEENGIIAHIHGKFVSVANKPHVITCAKKQIFLLERRKKKLEKLIELVYNERL